MNSRLDQWRSGLSRTSKSAFGRIANLLGASEISSELWDELEATLIQADLGIETTTNIIEDLKSQAQENGWTKSEDLILALRTALRSRLNDPIHLNINQDGLTVILIVGVNGTGKTTSVAKLANFFIGQEKKVMLAATDTFRAAGIEQLQNWGERLGVHVVAGQPEGDPGAVTFDAVQSAVSRKEDILFIDTAGRLHTRFNLMEELKKVHRVAGKALPGAPHSVLLVMDATTGQNAFQQAKAFKDAVEVSGVILAKLDSSARGGMAFSIRDQLDMPIYFAGLGEGMNDLQRFDPDKFVDGILAEFG